MSSIIVAGILIGIIMAICFLLISIDKQQKRKRMTRLLNRYSELGSKYDLNFSSQTILRDSIIAIDGVHRKLLILSSQENASDHYLIDLDQVKSCFVKKIYGAITGSSKDRKWDEHIETISLCFEFTAGNQPAEIFFYKRLENHNNQVAELEQKAKDLEKVFSKMINTRLTKIA